MGQAAAGVGASGLIVGARGIEADTSGRCERALGGEFVLAEQAAESVVPAALALAVVPSDGTRTDAVAAKDVPNAAGRQWNAESDELAVDPLVSPGRILRREAQDELSCLCRQWWTAGRPAPVGPAAADELSVPAQQRRRLDGKRPLMRSRQHLAERRQHGAIGCLEGGGKRPGA